MKYCLLSFVKFLDIKSSNSIYFRFEYFPNRMLSFLKSIDIRLFNLQFIDLNIF